LWLGPMLLFRSSSLAPARRHMLKQWHSHEKYKHSCRRGDQLSRRPCSSTMARTPMLSPRVSFRQRTRRSL